MYCYVYDEFLQDRKYERELAQIETRLTDLGIAGKIARLALFRDASEVIRDEIRGGASTVVAVGNDATLRRVLHAVGDTRTVVAFIPLGPQGIMAGLLGMPSGAAACDVLSARIVEELDVGEVNGRRFLQAVRIDPETNFSVSNGEKWVLKPLRKCAIEVRNLAEPDDAGMQSPVDGQLSLITRVQKFSLLSKKIDVGVIPFREVFLRYGETVTVDVDGESIQGKEFTFRVVPRMLRLVTGKGRKF